MLRWPHLTRAAGAGAAGTSTKQEHRKKDRAPKFYGVNVLRTTCNPSFGLASPPSHHYGRFAVSNEASQLP